MAVPQPFRGKIYDNITDLIGNTPMVALRRMTAAVGHPTLRLIRVQVGPWALGKLRAGEWQHRATHALADTSEDLEPVAAGQGFPRTHSEASEFVGICFSWALRSRWVRSRPCAGAGVFAPPRL